MNTPIDLSRAYAWVRPPVLIERDATTVQIGAEPADSLVLRHAPPGALAVLEQLDGSRPLGELLAARSASTDAWAEVAAALLEAGLVRGSGSTDTAVPGPGDPAGSVGLPAAEALRLSRRGGRDAARSVALARRDAIVVIHEGVDAAPIAPSDGRTDAGPPGETDRDAPGAMLDDLLARSGVGHLHRIAGRRVIHDISTPPRARDPAAVPATVPAAHPPRGRRDAERRIPRRDRPAGHQLPTVAVLVGPAALDLPLAATLTLARVPHVAVTATGRRAVVGPLVLPGRSSCLWCLHRHRVDADPAWPAVVGVAARRRQTAPAVVASFAATLAAHEVLALIDGLVVPASVDGTLEWNTAAVPIRRRTWLPHAECVCGAVRPG